MQAVDYAGLAEAEVLMGAYEYGDLAPRARYDRARLAARRAVELDRDRRATILDALVPRRAHPRGNVIQNPLGILRARIVTGNDDMVGEPLGHRPHQGPLPAIAIAAAPEDDR